MASRAASADTAEFPGGHVLPITEKLAFDMPHQQDPLPVFRIMNEDGSIRKGAEMPKLGEDLLLKLYTDMCRLKVMDTIFYDAQRQGRISFYMTHFGEEGAVVGSAAGLEDTDMVYGQYREAGVLMWRGFTLQQFADQCFSNEGDPAKGRQMPVHYGSKEHHFQTISSPLATQIPQASGAGYALRVAGSDGVVACYFGEGAASEGDFHAAMNFASTLKARTLFFCRNNGYAISTPVADQYAGDGIASRAHGYGMPSIRVDGSDAVAVLVATRAARQLVHESNAPVMVEAMSYRAGHHSTSDDSTRYRSKEEIAFWQRMCPIARLRAYMTAQGAWDEGREKELQAQLRKDVMHALSTGEHKPKPPADGLFEDVYDTMPPHLKEQQAALHAHMDKYPKEYELGHHH